MVIEDFYIISIVSFALSSNIFFICGNLAFKVRVWIKSRKTVAPLKDNTNETENYFKDRKEVLESKTIS